MSKKQLGTGVRARLAQANINPIYDKGGILIYEIDTDLYMLTNDGNQFNFTGNKIQTCEKWPDFCASN